jgi:transposase
MIKWWVSPTCLSLAVRMLTLIEFVVRRNLKQNKEKLTGLIENNPKKGIDNPTAERLLKAFDEITHLTQFC